MNSFPSLSLDKSVDCPRIVPRSPFNEPAYTFELKYPGQRSFLCYEDGICKLVGRDGKRKSPCLELKLTEQFRKTKKLESGVFDGQVMLIDRQPIYQVFDVLIINDYDLRSERLDTRQMYLSRYSESPGSGIFRGVISIPTDGRRLLQLAIQINVEGVMAKKLDEKYSSSVVWNKVLNPHWAHAKPDKTSTRIN